jgi:hypothetical protein
MKAFENFKRMVDIISSCETLDQLVVAKKMVLLLEKQLSNYNDIFYIELVKLLKIKEMEIKDIWI